MSDTSKKIVLIGNYLPDKQESMIRFVTMFHETYTRAGLETEVWYPPAFFGTLTGSTHTGPGKWLAYIDKYILFPAVIVCKRIRFAVQKKRAVFHICDHSNSPYMGFLPVNQTVITCHDVITIRGAMGFKDAYCESSPTGKILQKWILNNLRKARKIAFVSDFTRNQFLEVLDIIQDHTTADASSYQVIYNGFNAAFNVMPVWECDLIFEKYNLSFPLPYLLHIGSDLPRKNRKLLIMALRELKTRWNGVLCYAGKDIDDELRGLIAQYGLRDRVVCIVKPPHDLVTALYNRCEAFLLPSFSEGFGWPLIEAQACGAPVIASALEPMIEVCGGAALHADPYQATAFADAVIKLQNKAIRDELVAKGLKNCERFQNEGIISSYLAFYRS